jgi:hypothetical protein
LCRVCCCCCGVAWGSFASPHAAQDLSGGVAAPAASANPNAASFLLDNPPAAAHQKEPELNDSVHSAAGKPNANANANANASASAAGAAAAAASATPSKAKAAADAKSTDSAFGAGATVALSKAAFEVSVSDPEKKGEGMLAAHITYKVNTTRETAPNRFSQSSVARRYKDFEWLSLRLTERYGVKGWLIPPIPDKQYIGKQPPRQPPHHSC